MSSKFDNLYTMNFQQSDSNGRSKRKLQFLNSSLL